MEKLKIYVVEKSYSDYSAEQGIIEKAGGELLFAHCKRERDIIEQCGDADALLLRQTPVGDEAFQKLTKLRVISRYGIGYDNVDVESATKHGALSPLFLITVFVRLLTIRLPFLWPRSGGFH